MLNIFLAVHILLYNQSTHNDLDVLYKYIESILTQLMLPTERFFLVLYIIWCYISN